MSNEWIVWSSAYQNCACSRCIREAVLNLFLKFSVRLRFRSLNNCKKVLAAGFELNTSNFHTLKEVVLLDRNIQVGQIEELLEIQVEGKRRSEDAGKNGWTTADFGVMMVMIDLGAQQIGRTEWLSDQFYQHLIIAINHQTCDPHTSVHHDHLQRLRQRNLWSHRLLRHLPFTTAHCRARYRSTSLDQVGMTLTGDI